MALAPLLLPLVALVLSSTACQDQKTTARDTAAVLAGDTARHVLSTDLRALVLQYTVSRRATFKEARSMRSSLVKISAVLSFVALTAYAPAVAPQAVAAASGPQLQSIGPLSFGPNGVLYAADPLGATL